MIQDIPTSEDFIKAGKAQFDFAWDIVVSFLKLFDEAGDYGVDINEDAEDFWEAAKQRIQTALAITQQGVELIIKGKIVNISRYLLIAASPSDWPKPNYESPLSFSDFRTIDAQDLIKTHNLFSEINLSEDYKIVEPMYAVLRPNTPESTGLYCFVCRGTHPVTRKDCGDNGCKGNVISDEHEECCTCGTAKG